MLAEIPVSFGADSAWWTAPASGWALGTGPELVAATAIAVPPAITASVPAIVASSRLVEAVRRNFNMPHTTLIVMGSRSHTTLKLP
jgi:hypothetical protein